MVIVVTDETMREIVIKEKKKLFMRLYTLPWLGLTTALILIIILQWTYFRFSLKPETTEKTEKTEITEKTASLTDSQRGIFPTLANETNKDVIVSETRGFSKAYFTKEAVEKGHGEWVVNKEGEVSFKWKPSTESMVQAQVNIKLKALQESYKTNAIEILENKRKETITECRRDFQIEAVNKGVGKWVSDNSGVTEFRWKSIPEIVLDYTNTESNKLADVGMIKRELPFTQDNYRVARNVGIDIEGELIKRVSLSIETVFWGSGKDNIFKEKVKAEVNRSIHGMFDGFEALNRVNK